MFLARKYLGEKKDRLKGSKKEMPNKKKVYHINSPTPGCNIFADDPAFLHTFHFLTRNATIS